MPADDIYENRRWSDTIESDPRSRVGVRRMDYEARWAALRAGIEEALRRDREAPEGPEKHFPAPCGERSALARVLEAMNDLEKTT